MYGYREDELLHDQPRRSDDSFLMTKLASPDEREAPCLAPWCYRTFPICMCDLGGSWVTAVWGSSLMGLGEILASMSAPGAAAPAGVTIPTCRAPDDPSQLPFEYQRKPFRLSGQKHRADGELLLKGTALLLNGLWCL
jgi:hypothetical protein